MEKNEAINVDYQDLVFQLIFISLSYFNKKIFMKTNCLLFCLFMLTQMSFAQYNPTIPVKKLNKEFRAMVSMLEAHPSLFRHVSQEQFTQLVDSTNQLINRPMTKIEFYKLVSPIYSAIKDGHTSIGVDYDWKKKYKKNNGVFPYKIYLDDDNRMHLIGNYSHDETIPLGSEVLMINKLPVADFLQQISKYISYEQENFRNSIIQSDIDFFLLLQFGEIQEVDLTYKYQETKNHTIRFVNFETMKKKLSDADKQREKRMQSNQPFEYQKLKGNIGLIKIYSFAVGEKNGYHVFLRNTFKKIAKDSITSLIIDVRGNTGGFPKSVSDLIHYISEKYFKTMAMSEMKVSNAYKDYFVINSNINAYRTLFLKQRHYVDVASVMKKPVGTRVQETSFFNESPQTEVFEYKGDTYLLIDKRSYSASSSFAATFRCYSLGLMIGEETGGTKVFYANNIGQTTPHSGLSCRVATTTDFTTCFDTPDEGIEPDLVVKPTIPQLVAQQDVALNYARLVIRKKQKMKKEASK